MKRGEVWWVHFEPAVGGEVPGAWVFVSEHVPQRHIGYACGTLTAGLTAGILLGSNDDIPAFRWVEKETGKVMSCSAPADCAEIESIFIELMRELLVLGNGNGFFFHFPFVASDNAIQTEVNEHSEAGCVPPLHTALAIGENFGSFLRRSLWLCFRRS